MFWFRQVLVEQRHKAIARFGQIVHPFPLGGRANFEILGQPIRLVSNQLSDPHHPPKCTESEQVNVVRVDTAAVRHEEVHVVTDSEYLKVTNSPTLLGFAQAGSSDKLKER